jgi:hypothetical protein
MLPPAYSSLPRLRLTPPQRASAAARLKVPLAVAALLLLLLGALLLLAAEQPAEGQHGGGSLAAPHDLGTALGGHQRSKLVVYAYLNSTLEDISSLQLFIQRAVLQDDSCDYLLLLPVSTGP